MSLKVKFDLKDLKKIEKFTKIFKENDKVYSAIGARLRDRHVNRFRTERAPSGAQWKKSIRARLDGGKTLTDTANLRNSITYSSSPKQVIVGSNNPYAKTVQEGTKPKGRGPRRPKLSKSKRKRYRELLKTFGGRGHVNRPWLGINKNDLIQVKNMLSEYLERISRGG